MQDTIALHGAVFFPNLTFESATVDFGSILNYTEVVRSVRVTNNSPLQVRYKWSFLVPHPNAGAVTFQRALTG